MKDDTRLITREQREAFVRDLKEMLEDVGQHGCNFDSRRFCRLIRPTFVDAHPEELCLQTWAALSGLAEKVLNPPDETDSDKQDRKP